MIAAIKNAWGRMLDPKARDDEYQKHLAFSGLTDELMMEIYKASGAGVDEITISAARAARRGYDGDAGLKRLRTECQDTSALETAEICMRVSGRWSHCLAIWILETRK